MKPEQLLPELQKTLKPVYLVSGDEPLQLDECADAVRAAAKQAGFTVRELIDIDQGDEWSQLALEADSLSIFAEKKLIDLRLHASKPGIEGGKALAAYCQSPPAETVLLITTAKIDPATKKTVWFQAIEKVGVVVQVWPLQGQDLLQWLQRRAQIKGMRLDTDATKSLAARIEGNLLAAIQEIEKLFILFGPTTITKTMIKDAVADSSRFDVFKLTEALLAAKLNRAIKILNSLKAEGVAAPIVLWALSREARTLLSIKYALKQGVNLETAFKNNRIWDKHKQAVQESLQRMNLLQLQQLLLALAQADQQIKGQLAGDYWETIFEICWRFCNAEPGIRTV